MKIIVNNQKTQIAVGRPKFDHFTFSEDKLTLHYSKGEQKEIPFTQVDRIYIKKYKINPVLEFIGISLPFVLVYEIIQYFPLDLVVVASFFAIPPVFIKVLNYKWYRLCVRLVDGNIYSKSISIKKKSEAFSSIEKVNAKYLNYNFQLTASA